MRKLPEDVEKVLEGYRYSAVLGNMRVSVSGKRIVRRGRRILGLRSNFVKTDFCEDVTGSLRTDRETVTFSASDAEWDSRPSQPLILKRNVLLAINGKPLPHAKGVRIHFERGLFEVDTGRWETYRIQ